MRILITGASGYIGSKLAHALANKGKQVHALVRAVSTRWLRHPNITIFEGDVLRKESITAAMQGCKQVYHVAARVGVWASDPSVFYEVNVEGTRNVLDAALQTGVEKTVITSTCGVIGPALGGSMNEDGTRIIGYDIDYDLSKKMAEDLALQYAEKQMKTVIVSPSKVYGPGSVSHSLTANAIIDTFLKRKFTFIPSPGTYKVCFAFIDDVVDGHILAMEKGAPGERYILGGANVSYYDFFDRLRTLSGSRGFIIQLPKGVIKAWARVQELNHKIFGSPVRFTVKSVGHVFNNYTFSSQKAIRDLGYKITPLDEGLTRTINFLKRPNA